MTDLLEKGGCRWLTTVEHALETGSTRNRDREYVTCCHCKQRVPYTESYVTRAYGVHGNILPLPTFVHCRICALTLDPTPAWQLAYQRDKQAADPDPIRVKREEELNKRLNPFANPDLLP